MCAPRARAAPQAGGNCELTRPDEVYTTDKGVTIIGLTDWPSRMAAQSSALYANNISKLLLSMKPKEHDNYYLDMKDGASAVARHYDEICLWETFFLTLFFVCRHEQEFFWSPTRPSPDPPFLPPHTRIHITHAHIHFRTSLTHG